MIMHAFAPFLLLGLTIITFCVLGPRHHTERIASRAETLERQTGVTGILLVGLILYWLARLLIMQTAFVRLIQG